MTDADLVLGRLDPAAFAGGSMTLTTENAQQALIDHVGTPLDMTADDCAYAVSEVVDENMANAARVHAVERGVDIVLGVQPLVDDLDVVHEADEHVRPEGRDLIEIESWKQTVLPAEGGVGVDDDVLLFGGAADDVLERGAAEGMEAAERQVEDAPGPDVGTFGVHHVPHVAKKYFFSLLAGESADIFKIAFFIDADHAGNYYYHSKRPQTTDHRQKTEGLMGAAGCLMLDARLSVLDARCSE